jgi:hypothetical protein
MITAFSDLLQMLQRTFRAGRTRQPAGAGKFRPGVESLEGRALPSSLSVSPLLAPDVTPADHTHVARKHHVTHHPARPHHARPHHAKPHHVTHHVKK